MRIASENQAAAPSSAEVLRAFSEFAAFHGLVEPPRGFIADGKRHRCGVIDGKRGSRDGAYALHVDGVPAGWVQNWKNGDGAAKWCFYKELTPGQKAELAQKAKVTGKQVAQEEARRHKEAAKLARKELESVQLAPPDHPYLVRKGVPPHGLRIDAEGRLLVPLRDADGVIHSLQRIAADGSKLFFSGGRIEGCFHIIGELDGTRGILIGEGFATLATAHKATERPAVVACNCGNLLLVAKTIRRMHPRAPIVICADDDWKRVNTRGELENIEVIKAREAAAAVGGRVVVPMFSGERDDKATDFNDLAQLEGLDAVRRCILADNPASENEASAKQKPEAAKPRDDSRKPVLVAEPGELATIVTKAMAILAEQGTDIFQRGGKLVRPAVGKGVDSQGRQVAYPVLIEVDAAFLRMTLSELIDWIKPDKRTESGFRRINAPVEIAATILANAGNWPFRTLAGIISTPTLRHDGSILDAQGYDPQTHLYLASTVKLPPLAARPSRDEAEWALRLLEGLLAQFPFVNKESKSVALSAMLSAVARNMFPVVPAHGARAPTPGTGKSFLFDVVAAIALGEPCPVIAASAENEGETEKRVIGMALSGQSIIHLDNVNGVLGGDALCQLIERPICNLRPLGQSRPERFDNRAIIFFNGNNCHVRGDMTRRVLLAELDACMEKPAEREFTGNPVAKVMADRGKYIAACMTILRAYIAAGRPKQVFPPMNSFGEWSDIVRSALVWQGRADPCKTIAKARDEDPELQKLASFIAAAKPHADGPGKAISVGRFIELGNRTESDGYSGSEPGFRTSMHLWRNSWIAAQSQIRNASDAGSASSRVALSATKRRQICPDAHRIRIQQQAQKR